ncbi:hypothetical protein EJ07DRAFT_112110 [Lizonia empirigonia]|nr:hypothetical protein EJ07DRAFT_112110 [Lizonia empirigonia]
MRSATSDLCDRLITDLEAERATFHDDKLPLLSYQASAFNSCLDVLQEDGASLSRLTKQRRSDRLKVRTFMTDVYLGVGSEVFLLCIITTTITRMEKIPLRHAIPKLRTWWRACLHPSGLTTITKELCDAHSIGNLISSHQTKIGMRNTLLLYKG